MLLDVMTTASKGSLLGACKGLHAFEQPQAAYLCCRCWELHYDWSVPLVLPSLLLDLVALKFGMFGYAVHAFADL